MNKHDDDTLDMGFDIPEDALDHLDPEILKKWPQGLSDMLSVVEHALIKTGEDQHCARRHAFTVVRAISRLAGGRSLYVPQGKHLERALRDRALWELHNGHNVEELAERAGITVVQVYNIIAEQRKLARSRHQSDLFNESVNG